MFKYIWLWRYKLGLESILYLHYFWCFCTSSHLFSVHSLICFLYILSSVFCTFSYLFSVHSLICFLCILSSVFCTLSHLFSVHSLICFLYILSSVFCTSSHLFSVHPLICFLYILSSVSVHPLICFLCLIFSMFFLSFYVSPLYFAVYFCNGIPQLKQCSILANSQKMVQAAILEIQVKLRL